VSDPERIVDTRREGDAIVVLAPAVGIWSCRPAPGSVLLPGSEVGRLHVLNRRWVLRLPADVGGRVAPGGAKNHAAVEFAQELLRVAAVAAAEGAQQAEPASPGATARGVPEGAHAVAAPTSGVFYRRPSPGAAPFVEPGQRIRPGQPVGLVEVMKTFNQVVYGGPGLPDEVEVIRVCCADDEEVSAGQPLVIVR
jgi:acetyl-CoA carboxylase biotin carboxyl carrier protein